MVRHPLHGCDGDLYVYIPHFCSRVTGVHVMVHPQIQVICAHEYPNDPYRCVKHAIMRNHSPRKRRTRTYALHVPSEAVYHRIPLIV